MKDSCLLYTAVCLSYKGIFIIKVSVTLKEVFFLEVLSFERCLPHPEKDVVHGMSLS